MVSHSLSPLPPPPPAPPLSPPPPPLARQVVSSPGGAVGGTYALVCFWCWRRRSICGRARWFCACLSVCKDTDKGTDKEAYKTPFQYTYKDMYEAHMWASQSGFSFWSPFSLSLAVHAWTIPRVCVCVELVKLTLLCYCIPALCLACSCHVFAYVLFLSTL